MAMIASSVDGARVEHSEGWHISLLKRMANPFPDVRAAVISEQTYKALDRLRSFSLELAVFIAAMNSSDPAAGAGSG